MIKELRRHQAEIAVSLAAILGHLPILGAWWTLDDWSHLASASGLDRHATTGKTWSATVYWLASWPLLGLNAQLYAVTRLGLHALAAVLVVRLARRCHCGPVGQTLAGCVLAVSPWAFPTLYLASGGPTIIATVLALVALSLWLAPSGRTRGGIFAAAIVSLGAILGHPWSLYLAAVPIGLLAGFLVSKYATNHLTPKYQLPFIVIFAAAAITLSYGDMSHRLRQRDPSGLATEPLVRATALSWQGCQTLRALQRAQPDDTLGRITLLQPVLEEEAYALSAAMGERWVPPSPLHSALGGTFGPQLILGQKVEVSWVSGLTTASSQAIVLCEGADGLKVWGRLANALLYAALTDVGLGRFERARKDLARAAQLGGAQIVFLYDEGQMVIPLADVTRNKAAFTDYTLSLLTEGSSLREISGLQDLFFHLLSRSTGRSLADLTAGSRSLPVESPR